MSKVSKKLLTKPQFCSPRVITFLLLTYMAGFCIDFLFVSFPETRVQFFYTQFYQNVRLYLTYEGITPSSSEILQNPNRITLLWNSKVVDISLGLVDIFSTYCHILVAYCGDMLILMAAVTLWVPCRHFNRVIQQDMVCKYG